MAVLGEHMRMQGSLILTVGSFEAFRFLGPIDLDTDCVRELPEI